MEGRGELARTIPFSEASGILELDIADWEPCALQEAITIPVRTRLAIRTIAPFRRIPDEAFTVEMAEVIDCDRSEILGPLGLEIMVGDRTLQKFEIYGSVLFLGYVRPGPPSETPTNQE